MSINILKNKKFIAIVVIALSVSGSYIFFNRNSSDQIQINSYMKNLTWETDMKNDIPYKKGDELQLMEIFTGGDYMAKIDIDEVIKALDISEITFNGKKIDKDKLRSVMISSDSPTILKIKGKAKKSKGDKPGIKADIISKVNGKKEKQEKKNEKPTGKVGKIKLIGTEFHSNLNNLLEIDGNNLVSVDYVMIGEKAFKPLYDNGKIYIRIPKNTFRTGDYFILLQTKQDIIATNEKIRFDMASGKINIGNITPETITNTEERYVVLQGNGFKKLISIQLSNNLILKNTQFQAINDNVLTVKIPKGLAVGTYHFNLMDEDGIYEDNEIKLNISNN